jgi:hypothetical protein
MIDYTKNLTNQNTPIYGNVQYVYDAIGDTQGRDTHPLPPYQSEGAANARKT